jgi:hypothetical protein
MEGIDADSQDFWCSLNPTLHIVGRESTANCAHMLRIQYEVFAQEFF